MAVSVALLAALAAQAAEPGTAEAVVAALPEEDARQSFALRLGIRGTSVRDDLLVPLTFSGGGPGLGLSYGLRLGPGTLDARLDLGASVVANRFGHLGMTLDHQLAAAYLLPIAAASGWRFGAGAAVGESSDSFALQSWDDAHGYWLGTASLGVAGSTSGPLGGRWRLDATAELALLGIAGRPEADRRSKQEPNDRLSYYLFHPHADPRFFAPWDVQLVRFDVAARPVPRGWSFGLQGRVAHASFPQNLIMLESVLYVAWRWGA